MKRILLLITAYVLFTIIGCKKILTEEPRSILVPGFFSTSQGLQSGLDAAYAGMRNFWGAQNFFTATTIGTDDFQRGVDGNSDINLYASNYTPSNGTITSIWRDAYTFINTCNGVIDNAGKADLSDATKKRITAEAKFLRSNYYFILVQFYGDVTLNKNFQTTPTTSASRAPLAEVYEFIVQDLKDAIGALPASPKSSGVLPGKATAAAAKHVLSKVYLTRAGSSARKTDDYQNAYTTAMDLINTRTSLGLGLLPDFARVFAEGNEENVEVLWTVQHTSNIAFNGPNNSGVVNFSADNVMNHMYVGQYERRPGMMRDVNYGRPYIRTIPTRWLTDTIFKEKTKDTRYNKTFQTVWYANNASSIPKWTAPLPPGAPANAVVGQPKFTIGDTAIYMPGFDVTNAQIAAARYLLIPPRNYNNTLAPTVTKYFDTKRADLNAPSIRPVIVYRLAETYLIAAEAAFMTGRTGEAVTLINVLRDRSASAIGINNVQASDLSIDFILDERSRELTGELMRWWDLVRTGKLLERVRLHNPEARANIQQKHVLRPIPQSQIDATTTGDPYPQNPGW